MLIKLNIVNAFMNIKYWIIESKEAFDKYFPEMNFFCQTFPGSRLYLVLD